MSKIAFITGITGQDGAYLASLLINKGYTVYGGFRRSSSPNFWRIEELNIKNNPKMNLIEFDVLDFGGIYSILNKIKPDEFYNLAAQSFVGLSFDQPTSTSEINAMGVLNILEAIRLVNKKIKFYQASTSEMYGLVQETPQSEKTPFYPRSPYAISKLFSHWMCINFSESYNIFACSGILFNHESPLRGHEFVTRKITDSVAKLKLGVIDEFSLGNLDAKRDWGFAGDYVEGMWKMLQLDKPDTFVLATGETTTVRQFLKLSLELADIDYKFIGNGLDEHVIDAKTSKTILKINPDLYRPAEVDLLLGDSSKAKKILNWSAKKDIRDLCKMMYEADLKRNQNALK